MPAKTAYSRKTKWKTSTYRGERGPGGNFVYAGDDLLDKHLFVHQVAPGGFDWGSDAPDGKACQLAIALLAPYKGVDYAIENYHLFAENFVRRELTGDSWEISTNDFRPKANYKSVAGRDYPENTAPGPEDAPDLENVNLEDITYAEEIALAAKYEDVFWNRGNRRENLQRLLDIWNGEEDPSADKVSTGALYRMGGLSDSSSSARQTLSKNFETMGELAGWVLYSRNHSHMSGISDASAKAIRNSQPAFIQYFGGEEYIPALNGQEVTLDNLVSDDGSQQTLGEGTSKAPSK